MIQPAPRMETLHAHFFAALGAKITAMKADGCDVIRMDEGSPDLPPPAHILAALANSANSPDHHGYQSHRGTAELRRAWAQMYLQAYRVDLDPDSELLPLLGSKEGIFNLSQALVGPGDVVLVPELGYITYTRGAEFAGGEVVYLPVSPERGYLPDLKAIPPETARRAKLLWLNYPNNPTAAVATERFFAEAVDFAREYNLLVCHDAAYTQVTFTGRNAPSLLGVPGAKDVAVEFNTLSKSHNMAGWRLGAALGNPDVLRLLFTLKSNLDSSHFRPMMDAAVAAMTGDQTWLQDRNQIYRQRRDVVIQALQTLGLQAAVPEASLYVWSPVLEGWSSLKFTEVILDTAHVSLTPGSVFGEKGEGYIRIALTAPLERIQEAMSRIAQALSGFDHSNRSRTG